MLKKEFVFSFFADRLKVAAIRRKIENKKNEEQTRSKRGEGEEEEGQ